MMAILLGVFYSIWIGASALFTPDEGRYSEVAREMIATGDFITPRLNGVAFLDKPILYYWLQASAIKMFGLKEWSLRFWPATLGVLGCLVTYLAGAFLFNRRTGFIASLMLATSPLYYGAAHYANLDLEVAVLISNSLLFFIIAMQMSLGKQRSLCLVLAYIFAASAFLTKGLIGLAFPGLIIGSWIVISNRWNVITKMHLMMGLLLFAVIALPWYFLAQKANPEFLHFFFVTQQVSRFLTTTEFNNKTAFWFYIPIVIAGIFPWSILITQSVFHHVKKVWQNRQENTVSLFLLLWFFIIFTFFSIPKSKTVGYIIPIFPALTLLIANFIDNAWSHGKSKGMTIGAIEFASASIITSICFFVAPHIDSLNIHHQLATHLYQAGALFLIAGLITVYLLKKKSSIASMFYCMLGFGISFTLILSATSPALNNRSIKPLTMELNSIVQPEDEIVTYYKFYYDLPIYTGKRITVVADWNAPDIVKNDNWTRELWYGMPFQNTQDWLISKEIFWQRWNSDKRLYVLTDSHYYDELKSVAKNKIFEIARFQNTVLLTNQEIKYEGTSSS